MNLSLRPATAAAIRQFRARRSNLLWLRAFLCLLAIAIAGLLVIALLDRCRLMPEIVRPWVSIAVYVACFIAAWKVAWRFIGLARSDIGAAALIETAEPSLRERLLAAVELSQTGDTERVPDSPEFRAKLQEDVASAVGGMSLKKALPSRSLGRWWLLVFLAVAAVIGLSFVPQLHLPGFMARAALPFANLERPSSVKIAIVRPSPSSTKAPFASEVDLAADITGPRPEKAVLEFAEPGQKTRRLELANVAGARYEGKITIGQTDVRYRILAADAITPWHTLAARARPRVVEFKKTLVPPAYTGLPEQTLTEDHGDIEALEGATVRLSLKTNQPVAKSAMVLNPDQPSHPAAPAAKAASPTEITSELPINTENNSWQIALTSEETGFTNDDASPWQITAVPDLPPTAQITEPQEQVSLLPDESARIAGLAADDIGLATVRLSHAVNGADWKDTGLATKPGKEAAVQHLFSLAPVGVRAGDTVLVKLVAIDLKGQKAESQPLRIIVLEQTVDPRQRQWAAEQQRLAQQAKDLAEKTRDLREAVQKVQKNARLAKKNQAANDPENALAKTQEALDQVKEKAEDLWADLKKAAQSAPNQLDAQEALMLGEKLAQMRQEAVADLDQIVNGTVENQERLKSAASEAANRADTVADAARVFAAEDTAKVAAQAAQQLHRQENLLTENALGANRDGAQRPKWQEQQKAAIAAAASVDKDLETLGEQIDGGQKRNLDELRKQVASAASDLRESFDKPGQAKSAEHLYGASDNLRQRLGRTAEAARGIQEHAASQAAQMRQRLQAQDNPALVAIEQAKAELHQAAAEKQNPKSRPKPSKDGLTREQRAEQNLAKAARQLQDQAELREQNPLTNDQSALDMNRASRAADKMARETREMQQPDAAQLDKAREKATALAEAARTLEADALAQTAAKALAEAATPPPIGEKSDATEAAAQARAAAEQLRELPQALRRVNAPQEMANTAQRAADTARGAADDLQNQAKQMAQQPAGQPRQQLNQQPAQNALQAAALVAEQLAPKADEARGMLAQLTPQVSEMLKNMAGDLQKTQQETQAAANDAKAQKPVDAVAQQAQQLQPKAAANAQQMQNLQAALRQEANQANLAEQAKRQMARTADVALEQMRNKSPQVAQNLKQAAQASQSQPQAEALQNAADMQQQAAQALDQLAANFEKMEAGQQLSEQDLAAQAQMEQQLDVQEPLDAAYNRAQELAEMAKKADANPAEVLAQLEKELPKNAAMQKALSEIGKATATKAEANLAEKASQPAALSMAAEFAAHDLARVARHDQRLGQQQSAQQVAQASSQLQKTAADTKSDPSKASPQVAQQAQANAAQAAQAAEQAAAATPPALAANPFEQAQGMMLAQALDQLDQALHPLGAMNASQQPAQQGQQSAQQQLSQARQNQQQQMASQRANGQTPGQTPSQQQMAQNKKAQQDGQQSQEGGNFSEEMKDGALVSEAVLATGDWGRLPSRMAKDLTEATRQEAPPEYRSAIESYYKAIATKAKK